MIGILKGPIYIRDSIGVGPLRFFLHWKSGKFPVKLQIQSNPERYQGFYERKHYYILEGPVDLELNLHGSVYTDGSIKIEPNYVPPHIKEQLVTFTEVFGSIRTGQWDNYNSNHTKLKALSNTDIQVEIEIETTTMHTHYEHHPEQYPKNFGIKVV